jgi:hypothetical protein
VVADWTIEWPYSPRSAGVPGPISDEMSLHSLVSKRLAHDARVPTHAPLSVRSKAGVLPDGLITKEGTAEPATHCDLI